MKNVPHVLNFWLEPFSARNGIDFRLILAYGMLNGLVLLNAALHDPRIGYDSYGHLAYIETLSKLRIPTPQDTKEFFSPPLPYLIPALLQYSTGVGAVWAAKAGQLMNVALSLGLTFFLIKTCHLISPHPSLKLGTLGFLGVFPVYYKTFALVRGEPYVAFFAAAMLYLMTLVLVEKRFSTALMASLGTAMGLCFLSRQWGVLLLPAFAFFTAYQWIRWPTYRRALTICFAWCLLLSGLLSGWFYGGMRVRYGSVTAFNRQPGHFSFSNQPLSFYSGLGSGFIFSQPVRPHFANQLLPIFYSEMWGDYWGYLVLYGKDTRRSVYLDGGDVANILSSGMRPEWMETNYETIPSYLGRVNIVGLFPTALGLVSLVFAVRLLFSKNSRLGTTTIRKKEFVCLLLITLATSIAGYCWFLIMYPDLGKGDTIKATYMLQVFLFVSLLVGLLIRHLEVRLNRLYHLALAGMWLCFFHNIPAMVTRYSLLDLF